MKKLFLSGLLLISLICPAQTTYRYNLSLVNVKDDQLQVTLLTPATGKSSVTFAFPRIIPGTYSIADYGKFISNVKAFDKNGKNLPVSKTDVNRWKITNAIQLAKITYTVDDIFDADQKHDIFPMAATNIEDGKNFVLHAPGVFGYFEGMNKTPFEINIEKPAELFGSTSLKPVTSTATKDVFRVANLDDLYDAPIMYSVPDTTTVKVANAEVLISVYSPKKQIRSKQIAEWLSELLEATKNYLGGKLPAEKYAFIYYFKDLSLRHSFPPGLMGALEHNASSFYYLPDVPAQQIKNNIVNTSSHEFFHIITPLTIASQEVKNFNFSEAVLSKHLWLYEGVTEYTAHHVQAKYGLQPAGQFLKTLSDKITVSKTKFMDTLSFTELSKQSAGKHKDQYENVYYKGALIAATLDIYLLHLSNGMYGLRNLTYDLGIRYGRDRAFVDDELFDEIGKLTYPEIKTFLDKHVAGGEPIPYDHYFGLAGIKFTPRSERQVISFGGIAPNLNSKGVLFVSAQSKLNDFGKELGYKIGDELYAFNNVPLTPQNIGKVIDSLKKVLKEGDRFEVKVGRTNESGQTENLTLAAPVKKITEVEVNKLEPIPTPTAQQEVVRKAWLTATATSAIAATPQPDPSDVASIDAIIKATYDVISGPPGPRNWQRFHSLFLPEAKMGALVNSPSGEKAFHTMTPQDYQRSNGPFFMQSGFFEEELGRQVEQYGDMAIARSAYQFRMSPGGPVAQRGVNHFTLAKSGGRWWIINLSWQDEGPSNPIPASLLKK